MATANKTRLKFSKTGKIKFIGHLDLLTVFQQAVKRAGLPVCYSKGYNPHQLLYFAQPLPLGMESLGEYVDAVWEEPLDISVISQKLNNVMPEGINILEGRQLDARDKKAAAVVQAASYGIELNEAYTLNAPPEELQADIFEFDIESPTSVLVTLATGSTKNLSPKKLMEHLANGAECRYTRLELFKIKDGNYVTLLE